MTQDREGRTPNRSLAITDLGDSNRAAVAERVRATWDRPDSPEFRRWRFDASPTQEAAIALLGDQCVATMFGLRRSYRTPLGVRECLEPFDWHAADEWRAMGAGLRVAKRLMAGPRPILALGGTDAAKKLFTRLGWKALTVASRLHLPRRGRYLRSRGRSALVGMLFDGLGVSLWRPKRRGASAVAIEPATMLSAAVIALSARQRRFSLMRVPDLETHSWLRAAPPEVGIYLAFHVRVEGELAGWATARVYQANGMRIASIQEFFLADEHRAMYRAAGRELAATLEGFAPDVINIVSSCPDTLDAMRALSLRLDEEQTLFAWWPDGGAPDGPVLVDGGHAEWAFFPIATARESAWVGATTP